MGSGISQSRIVVSSLLDSSRLMGKTFVLTALVMEITTGNPFTSINCLISRRSSLKHYTYLFGIITLVVPNILYVQIPL